MNAGARTREAIEAVLSLVAAGRRADLSLAGVLRESALPEAARGEVHASVMALLRWRGWLEADIAADLDRAVSLARRLDGTSGTLPQKAALFARERGGARPEPWALFPSWMKGHLPDALPAHEREELLRGFQRPPPLWIRAQGAEPARLPELLAREGVVTRAHERLACAFEVKSGGDLYRTPAFREGRFEVQDLASQAVAVVVDAGPGERIWDACAGSGGKTLLLADRMGGRGSVLATDVHDRRLEELRRRARRGGYSNVRALPWSGAGLPGPAKRGGFDGVLVDAPCSGSGTFGRNPDVRLRVTPEDIERLAALSSGILAAAARGVRPGGRLIYATCSISRRENEDVVEAFLAAHPEFAIEPLAHPLTGGASGGVLRIGPESGAADAMFVARLRRGK